MPALSVYLKASQEIGLSKTLPTTKELPYTIEFPFSSKDSKQVQGRPELR